MDRTVDVQSIAEPVVGGTSEGGGRRGEGRGGRGEGRREKARSRGEKQKMKQRHQFEIETSENV